MKKLVILLILFCSNAIAFNLKTDSPEMILTTYLTHCAINVYNRDINKALLDKDVALYVLEYDHCNQVTKAIKENGNSYVIKKIKQIKKELSIKRRKHGN